MNPKSKRKEIEDKIAGQQYILQRKQKELLTGSMTLDHVAVRRLKKEIEDADKEIRALDRKLENL